MTRPSELSAARDHRNKPFIIVMGCGHMEIRLMPKTSARPWRGPNSALLAETPCSECDPAKASRREYQRALNLEYDLPDNSGPTLKVVMIPGSKQGART